MTDSPAALPSPVLPPGPPRSGFVALVGRPNVGKSTLLNKILKYRLAIISSRPQTTRNRIAGIWTLPGMQAVLLDTPGLHRPTKELNRAMVDAAASAVGDSDVVVWVVDPQKEPIPQAQGAIATLLERSHKPVILAINKVDLLSRPSLLPVMSAYSTLPWIVAQVPLSALSGEGLDALQQEVSSRLPEGEPLYPEDQLALLTERFIAAEAIREKVFLRTSQEIPYATAVVVEQFKEEPSREDPTRRFIHIIARIIVEKSSQRGILIGAGGSMLKRIGTEARLGLEKLLDSRIHLELHVSVDEDWTRNPRKVKEYGSFKL